MVLHGTTEWFATMCSKPFPCFFGSNLGKFLDSLNMFKAPRRLRRARDRPCVNLAGPLAAL